MHLLVAIVHREELLDEVLSVLVEMELPDSVVLESRTGFELLEHDLPIFAGLRSLIPAGIDFSRVVVSVIEEPGLGPRVLAKLKKLATPRQEAVPPNAAFLIPVDDRVVF